MPTKRDILGVLTRGELLAVLDELVPTETNLARAEGRSFESAEEMLKRVNVQADLFGDRTSPKRGRKTLAKEGFTSGYGD